MRLPCLALVLFLPAAAHAGDAAVRLPDAAAVPAARPSAGAEQPAAPPSDATKRPAGTPERTPDETAALAQRLPDGAEAALGDIADQGRRLLALRSYLRSERSLEARWSWTKDEIAAFEASDAHDAAMQAVAKVTNAFEAANPGYSLYVNTHVRSLEEQIGKWNGNASVAVAGAELESAYADWARDNPKAGADALAAFLSGWQPKTTVMVAAPGLSPHGRAAAFDFQVSKDGAVIAAADTAIIADVWEKDGWARKLKAAVEASGAAFKGPLDRPPEPWHYEYDAAK